MIETIPSLLTDVLIRARELVAVGGPVVVILLALSVLATAIVLAKIWQFAKAGIGQGRLLEQVTARCRAGDRTHALHAAGRLRGPAGAILAGTIEARQGGADPAHVRESAMIMAAEAGEILRSWMRPLEVIASLAPLIGLFGTVLGMIDAFARLEEAGSRVDPSILSGGIWVALLTTAVGLAVAIPTLAAFNWLERRIERFERALEIALATILVTPSPARAHAAPTVADENHAAPRLRSVAAFAP